MSNQDGGGERDHLEGVECGAGCTEIWEHLSDHRREESEATAVFSRPILHRILLRPLAISGCWRFETTIGFLAE